MQDRRGREAAAVFLIMPKLTAPFFSHDARGTLAKILTYLKTKRGTVCKRRHTPRNPQTQAQVYRRLMFAFLQQNWATTEPEDKATWQDLADDLNISPINAYLGTNLERWDYFETPSTYLPIQQTGSPGSVAAFNGVYDNGRTKLTVDLNMVNQNWGAILYHRYLYTPSHTPTYVFAVELHNTSPPKNYYHYTSGSGWHFYKLSLFSINGEIYHWLPVRPVWYP